MLSIEYAYKVKLLRRFVHKAVKQIIRILFVLASLATLGLMAYEFGYSIPESEGRQISEVFKYLVRIFFFGSLTNLLLNPKDMRREKGFWIETALLLLLLFVMVMPTPGDFSGDKGWQRTDHILLHLLLLSISIIHLSKIVVTTLQRHIRPEMMFAYSFLGLIFIGAALLMLPNAHHGHLHFMDALFTSTSAVCITGLTTVDTSATFTLTGQVILLLLIQIGGVGVMTFTSFIALSFFTQTSFNDRMALKNILSEESMNNIFRTLAYTFFTTLLVETAGSLLIWREIRHVPPEIIPNRTFFSIFHSVSAFCNAGFSTLPDNLYNPAVRHLYGFQGWIAVLVILGGIGFPIVFNYGKLVNHKIRNLLYRLAGSSKRMASHVRIVNTTTRIVIVTTVFLLVTGSVCFWAFENKGVLADLPFRGKLAVSFLGSATPRTAGFNSVAMDALATPTVIITMFLMWVGASPLSTGGGIKTTTFTLALKSIVNTLKGKKHIEVFKRQVPDDNIRRAFIIILLSILWIIIATLSVSILVPEGTVTQIFFEVISAISTVGLTLDFTPQLTLPAKIIICLTMFVGRVGLITLLSGFVHRQNSQNYTYAEDQVIL